MKILLLSRRLPPEQCGVGDFTWRLAEELSSAQGAEVAILTAAARLREQRPPGVRIIEHPLRGWRDLRGVLRVVQYEEPDVVQLEYSGYGWSRHGAALWVNALVALLRLRGTATCVAFHEMFVHWSPRPLLAVQALLQRAHVLLLALAASTVVANTPSRVRWLSRRLGPFAGKVRFRPNASNIPVAPRDESTRAAWRERGGARPESVVVATFGAFHAGKNHAELIRGAALASAGFDLRLWFLGDSCEARAEYLAGLRELVRAAGLEAKTWWSGRLPAEHVSQCLQAADVFVLPQRDGHLTRSGAFMAAAAHGLPVIAVRNPAEQAMFAGGSDVLFAADGDAESLAAAIRTLAADSALRRTLGENLRRLYEARFAWPRIAATPLPGGTNACVRAAAAEIEETHLRT